VIFPSAKNGSFQFQGQDKAILVRSRANAVWTDAATGVVMTVVDARDASLHQRISEAADPLHFGTFGGIGTKLLWFAFGVAMTATSVSGVAVYATRLARAKRQPVRWRAALAAGWQGMGVWRWPSLAALIIAFALLPALLATSGGD
jgi:uncharacterized iron-regulated membrane protein